MPGLRVLSAPSAALAACFSCAWLAPLVLQAAWPSPAHAQNGERSGAGERIYRAACQQCHGADGRGRSNAVLGFSRPVPDFTDCNFATREPNTDWLAIISAGGPARAFHEIMPAFGVALSRDEIGHAIEHLRGFCSSRSWPRGELNLPRPLVLEKAFPEDEAVFNTGITLEGNGAVLNEVVYERRFGPGTQVELKVPFGWRERERAVLDGGVRTDWTGGIGDMAVGVKQVMVHSLRRGVILSAGADVIIPTGDEDDGFGAGTMRFETFLAGGLLFSGKTFVQTQAGLELPASQQRATEEGFGRLALGKTFTQGRFGRLWSPMVELLWLRELTSGAPSEWDLVPQMQVTLSKRQHIMANLGVRVPLSQTHVRQTELLFYLLWDWFDGGLREGW